MFQFQTYSSNLIPATNPSRPVLPPHIYPPPSVMRMNQQPFFIPSGQGSAYVHRQYPMAVPAGFYPLTGRLCVRSPTPQPPQEALPLLPKKELKLIRIRDPCKDNRDVTDELLLGGKATAPLTPPPSEGVLASGINVPPAPAADVLTLDEHVKHSASSSPAPTSSPVSEPLPPVQSEGVISDVSQNGNQDPNPVNHKEAKEEEHKEQHEVQQYLLVGKKKIPFDMSRLTENTQRVKLFVKNLDYSVDDQLLRKEFLQFGTIISAKVVMENGRSRGFGFVCFSSPEEATKAIAEMNGRMLGRRPLHVAPAQSKEERMAYLAHQHKQRTESRQPTKPRPSLQKATQSVQLQNVQLMPPFIHAATVETVGTLTTTTNHVTRVGKVHTNRTLAAGSTTDTGRDAATVSVAATESDVVSVSDAATVSDAAPAPVREEQQDKDRSAVQKTQKPLDAQRVKLFVNNLEYSVDDQRLHKEFLPFGTVISAKVVMENGRSRGFGLVRFSSREEATKAIAEMNGRMLGRRTLHVAMAQSREERMAYLTHQQRTESRQLTKPRLSPHKTTHSVQLQNVQNTPHVIHPATAKTVNDPRPSTISEKAKLIVKNLDHTVDDKQLRKEFLPFGTVISAKVVMENDCPQGFGFVSFLFSDEAMKAIIEMNGKMLGRKLLHVALETTPAPEREKLQDKDPSGVQNSQQPLVQQAALLLHLPIKKSNKKKNRK